MVKTKNLNNSGDKVAELNSFHSDLIKYYNTLQRVIDRKNLSREESEAGSGLLNTLARRVGYLGELISELTGLKTVDVHGKDYDMWVVALKIPVDELAFLALGFCIQATNRAIGQLENDIVTGIRDRKTGKMLNKSGISGSALPEALIVKANWKAIEKEFGITKTSFGRKINFVTDPFKRAVIFRDAEQAFTLASLGFSKPAVLLAGGVIEELLRLYLEHKQIRPIKNDFDGYIQTCEQHGLLKDSVSRLSHSVRQFRNLVHLSAEETKKHAISKATAIGAVSAIFTIANDF